MPGYDIGVGIHHRDKGFIEVTFRHPCGSQKSPVRRLLISLFHHIGSHSVSFLEYLQKRAALLGSPGLLFSLIF
jgi:hypothetical protein